MPEGHPMLFPALLLPLTFLAAALIECHLRATQRDLEAAIIRCNQLTSRLRDSQGDPIHD